MIKHEYGTAEYYCEMFSDILADCGTGVSELDDKSMRNVMAGFEQAIISWLEYHEGALKNYRDLHRRFITGDLDAPESYGGTD